jgi:tetratricopeptide (TPR) repeat protein
MTFVALPESLAAARALGEEALTAGRAAEARAWFARAFRFARPGVHELERIELAFNSGVSAMALGDTAAADADWLRAVALARGHHDALRAMGRAYARAGRFEETRTWVGLVLSHRPDDPESLFLLATSERALGHTGEADRAWRRLVAVAPAAAESLVRAWSRPAGPGP